MQLSQILFIAFLFSKNKNEIGLPYDIEKINNYYIAINVERKLLFLKRGLLSFKVIKEIDLSNILSFHSFFLKVDSIVYLLITGMKRTDFYSINFDSLKYVNSVPYKVVGGISVDDCIFLFGNWNGKFIHFYTKKFEYKNSFLVSFKTIDRVYSCSFFDTIYFTSPEKLVIYKFVDNILLDSIIIDSMNCMSNIKYGNKEIVFKISGFTGLLYNKELVLISSFFKYPDSIPKLLFDKNKSILPNSYLFLKDKIKWMGKGRIGIKKVDEIYFILKNKKVDFLNLNKL